MLLLACLLLCACGKRSEPEAMFDNYLWRLANVTGIEADAPQVPAPIAWPPLRQRRLASAAVELGLLDFLELHRCGLGELLGRRNSSMGRVMDPVRRLDYELAFLVSARACLAQQPQVGDAELRRKLAGALTSKQAELPAVMWNALFALPDGRLFSPSAAALAPDQLGALTAARQSVDEIEVLYQRLLSERNSPQADPSLRTALIAALDRLARSSGAASLLRSSGIAGAYLEQGSRLLEQAGAMPMCRGGKTTRSAQHLHNVFTLFYIGQVQPYLAGLHRDGRQLLGALAELDQRLNRRPGNAWAAFRRHVLAPDQSSGEWQRFERAIQRHTRAWQELLGQCGLRPGTAPEIDRQVTSRRRADQARAVPLLASAVLAAASAHDGDRAVGAAQHLLADASEQQALDC